VTADIGQRHSSDAALIPKRDSDFGGQRRGFSFCNYAGADQRSDDLGIGRLDLQPQSRRIGSQAHGGGPLDCGALHCLQVRPEQVPQIRPKVETLLR
jgi:hypothetical protein